MTGLMELDASAPAKNFPDEEWFQAVVSAFPTAAGMVVGGRTLLHAAQDRASAEVLLAAGADPVARDDWGQLLLGWVFAEEGETDPPRRRFTREWENYWDSDESDNEEDGKEKKREATEERM